MYKVKLNNDQWLYYPGDKQYVISNPVLHLQLNDAGYFDFDIPQNNPQYGRLFPRQSMITIYKDDDLIFEGEIREIEQTLYGMKHIYAIGVLAFLNDSIQPQARYQTTPLAVFDAILNQHNSQVEEKKQFTRGMVSVNDPNDYIYRYTNYEGSLNAIKNDLCDTLEGYLRIRRENGARYLDLIKLDDYGLVSTQEIRLGKNLLDYVSNTNGGSIATAVVPLGAKLDKSTVQGLDAYLTIEAVNDGKNYVVNNDAIQTFGYCKVVKKWEDVTVASNLKAKAEEWLTSQQFAEMTYEIDAVDLSAIDASIDSFDLGDKARIVCTPYGIDTVTHVQALSITLDDPSKNKITLGGSIQQSITSRMASENYLLKEEIPSESTVLELAKDNAIEILEGTEGGYISFGFNEQNQIDEIRIMDSPLEESALKKWVWNLGGLGYLHRDSTSDPWTQLGAAITMDGQIVADFITTGTMYADRIRGGTLTLGGLNNTSGVLNVRDGSDRLIGSWDNKGIYSINPVAGSLVRILNGTIYGGKNNTLTGYLDWSQNFTMDGHAVNPTKVTGDAIFLFAPGIGVATSKESNSYYKGYTGNLSLGNGQTVYVCNGLITS